MDNKLKIGIIGSGKMGLDIFNYLCEFDFKISLICQTGELADEAGNKFHKRLKRLADNGIISADDFDAKIKDINITSDPVILSDSDIIIESVTEDLNIKRNLFNDIDKIAGNECIFATNSSSIVPSLLCRNKKRLEKFIGLHFFYPVKLKNIVELIITENIGEPAIERAEKFLNKINKFYIELNEENAFILNKAILDYQALGYNIYEEKILSIKEIDDLIKENLMPIGVFEFIDNVGIDVMCSSINEYIKEKKNKDFYQPLLTKLKNLKGFGSTELKKKAGFYSLSHDNQMNQKSPAGEDYKNDVINKLTYVYINSAYKIAEKNICSFEQIDYSMKEYLGVDAGPIELSKKIGVNKIKSFLSDCHSRTNLEIYMPSRLLY